MKGLIIKDLYQTARYCRTMVLVVVVFLGVSFFSASNDFFTYYPCLLCGMIPVTLLSYDERSGWSRYALAMPVTRAQLVGGKYLMGIIMVAAAAVISAAAAAVRTRVFGAPMTSGELLRTVEIMLAVGLMAPALCLPWMFKLGVEKGRLAYYAVIMLFFGGSAAVTVGLREQGSVTIPAGAGHALLLVAAVLFAASWALSAAFYKTKEF